MTKNPVNDTDLKYEIPKIYDRLYKLSVIKKNIDDLMNQETEKLSNIIMNALNNKYTRKEIKKSIPKPIFINNEDRLIIIKFKKFIGID